MRRRSLGAIACVVCMVTLLVGARAAGVPVRGRVLNSATGLVVPGATVSLTGSGLRDVTDAAGQFTLDAPGPSLADTLVVFHPDFLTARIPLGDVRADPWTVSVRLLSRPITALDAGAGNPEEDRR